MKVSLSFNFPKLKLSVICPISVILLPLEMKDVYLCMNSWCIIWFFNCSKQDLFINNLEAPVSHRVKMFYCGCGYE